ncbi:MAG: ATP phosphoribosyltransferase regulatory subunit [Clostridiales bacterium]|nr:ATP phosphoribosyltransferase regulatory subunit [Clostridiales bacterium]
MAFNKKAVTGMRDILPAEMEIRSALQHIIRETYAGYGFTEIETPIVEHIGNLTSKQGGENEKLIFKILKRGEKLRTGLEKLSETADIEESLEALTEEGLRYDLTLPLSRYYAANSASLPQPFKALQIGPVFRADRPQKGRFRQFVQCDIDILGDATNLAEKELILATTEALDRIGFDKFSYYVVINDRRFLFELIRYAGMPEEDAEDILITLDKADKIGAVGVDAELKAAGYSEQSVAKLRDILDSFTQDAEGVRAFAQRIGSPEALDAGLNVADIMESVQGISGRKINILFDPTLVRGMGYYTGTIFEIKTETFGSSVGGGGRYDRMVGRFTGQNVPAVGFSIGFERIMTILMDGDVSGLAAGREKNAWLIEKGMPAQRLAEIFDEAIRERAAGKQVLTVWMAKNKKFQKESLTVQGYTAFREFYREALK